MRIKLNESFLFSIKRTQSSPIRSKPHGSFRILKQSNDRITGDRSRIFPFMLIMFPMGIHCIVRKHTTIGSRNPEMIVHILIDIDNRNH